MLDSWVTPEVSRSEVVAGLIQAQADSLAAAEAGQRSPLHAPVSPKKARAKIPEGKDTGESSPKFLPITTVRLSGETRVRTTALAYKWPTLHVVSTSVPRGKKWKPEKYVHAERLLAQGSILTAHGFDYATEAGEIMSWRTVEALVGFGVLEEVPAVS